MTGLGRIQHHPRDRIDGTFCAACGMEISHVDDLYSSCVPQDCEPVTPETAYEALWFLSKISGSPLPPPIEELLDPVAEFATLFRELTR